MYVSSRSAFRKFFFHLGLDVRAVARREAGTNIYFQRMFDRITNVEGDVVECGVGKMRSFRMLAALTHAEGRERDLWGFDSFEGFPETRTEDESVKDMRKGQWKYLDGERDVRMGLFVMGFKLPWIDEHVKVVKGFFSDTMPKNEVEQIALLHLDVDLYDSYTDCLTHLFPKVSKGGVVMFDEYASRPDEGDAVKFPGAKLAIDAFFKDTPYRPQRDSASGKYFLVKA